MPSGAISGTSSHRSSGFVGYFPIPMSYEAAIHFRSTIRLYIILAGRVISYMDIAQFIGIGQINTTTPVPFPHTAVLRRRILQIKSLRTRAKLIGRIWARLPSEWHLV